MNKGCVYKLKDGKELNKIQEEFSKYVYIEDFAHNPLLPTNRRDIYIVYRYINVDTLQWIHPVLGFEILPHKTFKEHFELYMDVKELNKKLIDIKEERKS